MNFLVRPPFKQVAKGLPTFLTHVGCFSSVNFSVTEKGRVLGDISTCWTQEGPLFTVSHQVVEQRKGPCEGFPTATTLEGFLRSADSPRLLVTRAGQEGLLALGALVGLPLTVGSIVLEKVMAVQNVLATLPECEGFLSTVLLLALARVCTVP